MKLAHYVINKLTPHGMPKIQKFSPKFMLTQQTFDTCMFQFQLNIYSINGTISTWIFRGVRILFSPLLHKLLARSTKLIKECNKDMV